MFEVRPGAVAGVCRAPRSKSETHRAILVAALADGPVTIGEPLLAADTRASLAAAVAFGCGVEEGTAGLRVVPAAAAGDLQIDCANSGTTLRLATGIAAARSGATLLDGDASLRRRPMRPLITTLQEAGVEVDSDDGHAPLRVRGPLPAGSRLRIDAGHSSQYPSSLLLALTAAGGGVLELTGKPVSGLYLDMTRRALAQAGVDVRWRHRRDGIRELNVPAGAQLSGGERSIPGDWSSAAFLLCAGALAGSVCVTGLPPPADQADGAIVDLLREMGARVERVGDDDSGAQAWRVDRADLAGIDADLGGCPDLFPVLAVTLAHARGRSRLYGAPHLRGKESDRIAMVVGNLQRQGIGVTEHPDGASLHGGGALAGGPVETDGDHRILMAFAVGALAARRPLTFADSDPQRVTAVSYPTFIADLSALGATLGAR